MSSNKIYDAIQDAVITQLEGEAQLPERFVITLDSTHMKALLQAGMAANGGEGGVIPETETQVWIAVAGHDILLQSEDHNAQQEAQ